MKSFLEFIYVNKELHHVIFDSICKKYGLTITEVTILLLLHHEQIDTAKDIAMKFKIAKSHLSTSIRHLEEKGYIKGDYIGHDHRTIHLHLCKDANSLVEEISDVYQSFINILLKDFKEDEKEMAMYYLSKMIKNANVFLNE